MMTESILRPASANLSCAICEGTPLPPSAWYFGMSQLMPEDEGDSMPRYQPRTPEPLFFAPSAFSYASNVLPVRGHSLSIVAPEQANERKVTEVVGSMSSMALAA